MSFSKPEDPIATVEDELYRQIIEANRENLHLIMWPVSDTFALPGMAFIELREGDKLLKQQPINLIVPKPFSYSFLKVWCALSGIHVEEWWPDEFEVDWPVEEVDDA